MKERPIIRGYEIAGRLPPFKPYLRQAIRDLRKTMTRRVVKVKGGDHFNTTKIICGDVAADKSYFGFCSEDEDYPCPYGRPGEYRVMTEPLKREDCGFGVFGHFACYADDGEPVVVTTQLGNTHKLKWKWKKNALSSIHMPYIAARTIVKIGDIRVERLQDISEEDARAEGGHDLPGQRIWFEDLWDSINGKTHPWSNNDWVWVVSFGVV